MSQKKWYSFFVVTENDEPPAGASSDTAAPRRVTDVVPDIEASPAVDVAAAGPVDLSEVYDSARIVAPAHGYTVLKIASMLESEHIKALPPDVKRKSVLVALDAAGVKVDEIVEDAVRRDRALDTYERVLEKHVEDARAKAAAENKRLEDEIARQVADLRSQIDANRQTVEREEREFLAWRTRKHEEEQAIAQAIGYFVSENPITAQVQSITDKGDADVR
ncbi:MAG: hypothetical protein AB7P22_11385 [Vicinamibacterales bacterium]